MLSIHSWPEAILHLDADAFFASVAQAQNPNLKGKPVVTGYERGVATAMSYEAKKMGVTRGMRIFEVKKICPQATIITSDYKTYHLFSQKMFAIVRQYSPVVEEYSIDEGFVDLKGLRRPLNMSYEKIAATIKDRIEDSLGITVSIGVSTTKSLAKIAANLNKPSGLTIVSGRNIETLLKEVRIEKVWGIGNQTSAYLKKININNAYDFVMKPESFIEEHLSKPFHEIWLELRGNMVYQIDPNNKRSYKSITKSSTVTPPTSDKKILWSRLLNHVERAFEKTRDHNYSVGKIFIFLKTQNFSYHSIEIKLIEQAFYPMLIRKELKDAFEKIYKNGTFYRSTGCTVSKLLENAQIQSTLFFHNEKLEEKAKKIYPILKTGKVSFGASLLDKRSTKKQGKESNLSIPLLSTIDTEL